MFDPVANDEVNKTNLKQLN